MVKAVSERLVNRNLPPVGTNPYGDGQASERCAQAIGWLLGQQSRPRDWQPAG
jgi:UDP-N-acetylglucosamine 2-epimerase